MKKIKAFQEGKTDMVIFPMRTGGVGKRIELISLTKKSKKKYLKAWERYKREVRKIESDMAKHSRINRNKI